jgi:outer membrane protein
MKTKTMTTVAAVAAVATGLLATAANAEDLGARGPGSILVRVGTSDIIPQNPTTKLGGADLDVGAAWGFTFNVSYFFTKNIAVELLGAAPYEHDIFLGGSKIATTHHLPPTVSVQWHFAPNSPFQPYLGVGLNYTMFLGTSRLQGEGGSSELDLSSSFGPAVQGGFDFRITKNWFLNADARWIDIKSNLKIDGTKVAKVDISPVVVGLHLGYQF